MSDDEFDLLREQCGQLDLLRPYHRRQESYVDGTASAKSLGISIPKGMENIGTVVGWPATVATVPAERVRWRGWLGGEGLGLDEVATDSLVGFEFSQSGLESGVFGQGYLEVSEGEDDEPDVVVQALPATATTGIWDAKKHRLGAGYTSWKGREGRFERLFTVDSTITVLDGELVDRVDHRFGRPQLVRLANAPRPSRPNGQSDIDAFVRYATDNAVRSILGMEISREFFVNPQRYALGLEPEDFGIDPDAPAEVRKGQGWNAAASSLLVAPYTEDGDKPVLGQFTAEGPSKYWETVRYLAQMVANQVGLPESYLGFATENPASADAIRAHEYRLVQKCKARLDMGSWASREVALLALLTRDGDADYDAFRGVSTQWEDVETPTRAAAADAAQKMVASDILPADSQVTRDMVGLSPQQQDILASEKRKTTIEQVLSTVQTATGQAVDGQAADETIALKNKFDALGVAVRAGVDPEDAAARVGLSGIKFTGAVPVSLRIPESVASTLEDK